MAEGHGGRTRRRNTAEGHGGGTRRRDTAEGHGGRTRRRNTAEENGEKSFPGKPLLFSAEQNIPIKNPTTVSLLLCKI
jgi:hypothetical protein